MFNSWSAAAQEPPTDLLPPRAWKPSVAALLALALALRLYRLDHFSYWLDEALQSYWLHGTWSFFWSSLKFDAFHPPLDYLVGRLLEPLHPSDWARKIPVALWGVGTVWALTLFVARRAGKTAGLIGGLLLALAPFHVRYSQEFRPYSLGLLTLCLALLALDIYLERSTPGHLAWLFVACLTTLYALYVSAIVLVVAASALIISDSFAKDPDRRRAATRFLAFSPPFAAALWVAYLPWWPVVVAASKRPPMAAVEPLTLARVGRTLAFFSFAMNDGESPKPADVIFCVLCVAGLMLSLRREPTFFITIWTLGGLGGVELVGRLHPHIYATRRFLPAGLGLVVATAIALAWCIERPWFRPPAVALLLVLLMADAASLRRYYEDGRADWRPMAALLKAQMRPGDRLFVPGPYEVFTLAYYASGPTWLYDALNGRPTTPEIYSFEGQPARLSWDWKPGTNLWLLMRGKDPRYERLRLWVRQFPATPFPGAEASMLYRLDLSQREALMARPPWAIP
jgi:hypothetical protein